MLIVARFLLCLMAIEGHRPDQEVHGAAGCLAIKKIFVDEVNRILGETKYKYEDRLDVQKSIEMVKVWIHHRVLHNPEWDEYDLALAYTAGDTGAQTPRQQQIDYAIRVRNVYRDRQPIIVCMEANKILGYGR